MWLRARVPTAQPKGCGLSISTRNSHIPRPWKVNSPGIATGTGFHIGKKRILTNNHVVDSGTSIRVRRHGIPGNFEAVVLCSSGVCDLALVTVENDEFWDGIPVADFQDEVPALDDTVSMPVQAQSTRNGLYTAFRTACCSNRWSAQVFPH